MTAFVEPPVEEMLDHLGDEGKWLRDQISDVCASTDPNPYLTLVKCVARKAGLRLPPGGLPTCWTWMLNRMRPEDEGFPLDVSLNPILLIYAARRALVEMFSFAIPTKEAIDVIAKMSPILEIGAGSGYWAHLLTQAGATVVTIETSSCDADVWGKIWTKAEDGEPDLVNRYHGHTLFLCWPPYRDPMAEEYLSKYRGSKVIYIGERAGGCVADDGFFSKLKTSFDMVETIEIPQWMGMHDQLEIWERTKTL